MEEVCPLISRCTFTLPKSCTECTLILECTPLSAKQNLMDATGKMATIIFIMARDTAAVVCSDDLKNQWRNEAGFRYQDRDSVSVQGLQVRNLNHYQLSFEKQCELEQSVQLIIYRNISSTRFCSSFSKHLSSLYEFVIYRNGGRHAFNCCYTWLYHPLATA